MNVTWKFAQSNSLLIFTIFIFICLQNSPTSLQLYETQGISSVEPNDDKGFLSKYQYLWHYVFLYHGSGYLTHNNLG